MARNFQRMESRRVFSCVGLENGCGFIDNDLPFQIGKSRELDGLLAKFPHCVHTARHMDTVPVNSGIFRKFVRHVDADLVPLRNFNGWAMNLTIEPPAVSAKSWREFVINFFSNQMEYLFTGITVKNFQFVLKISNSLRFV
jgi:hypothetical protein